jgi:hypothetical protein
MDTNKECFGNIFPDLEKMAVNKELNGKVFSVRLASMGIGINSREIHPDVEQWNACKNCEKFDSCYSFSQAKLSLYLALRTY